MAEKSGWMWVSMGLLCVAVVVSTVAAYYYGEYRRYQGLYEDTLRDLEAVTIHVSLLINYGNGTREWHNNTRVPVGFSVLNATLAVAEVDYAIGQYGAFVTAINGVGGDTGMFWIWLYWNATSSEWKTGPVASDMHVLHNGDLVAWSYTSEWPPPPP